MLLLLSKVFLFHVTPEFFMGMFGALVGYLQGQEWYLWNGPDPYTHTGPWVPMVWT
jgi:hypothetical protein